MLSKKLMQKIENPQCAGFFTQADAEARGVRLAIGKKKERTQVQLYLLVDLSDGVIADARFQVFGPPALIGAAEAACEILLRKNYDQARRLSADLLDKQMRDKSHIPAFPESAAPLLNGVLEAIEEAAEQCMDIPISDVYIAPPLSSDPTEAQEIPGWKELSTDKKISIIEQVIAQEIRPYIELDAGNIKILRLVDDRELIIAYEGSCTTCYSATGATLSAIQQILRTKVHPTLTVTPDLSLLSK